MTIERRRLAAQKAFDRIRKAGLPMEEDPRFLGWVDEWIAGDLSMLEFRQRYLDLLRERASEQASWHRRSQAARSGPEDTVSPSSAMEDRFR